MNLLNPQFYKNQSDPDAPMREIALKTIDFFETRGKRKLKRADHDREWYADFLEFQKQNQIFSTLLTPTQYGNGHSRWDTSRICKFNELLGFYGLSYWYTWQVSMLGLGPIWMSKNEPLKKQAAEFLKEGGIFAFGLSEKDHGADLYATEMRLFPINEKLHHARGRKYYIGNAQKAALVSTFGKFEGSGDFVFFAVAPTQPNYECLQNVVNSPNYVGELALNDYPITEKEILSRGQEAWDTALNTINICKFNLGWASIGSCTHAFYEAINHASKRRLFDHWVTDFPHIQTLFVEAFTRLFAMKLFSTRAIDYLRSASESDRRYLLFNPIVKMKVTSQGEQVINLLWDVIAAKGFEKDTFFETAAREIRALPKLEGTIHVNMALIIKFMKNYFFNPGVFPDIPPTSKITDDSFLFNQGATKGLGKIQFHDYRTAFESVDLPSVKTFRRQIAAYKRLLFLAGPSKDQIKDFDFLLIFGELFTLVAYGQLIIEQCQKSRIENDLLDQIFDFMVRDFSHFALRLYAKPSTTRLQAMLAQTMIRKPSANRSSFLNVWQKHVHSLRENYEMKP